MHTFLRKRTKQLKMCKLSDQELGPFRMEMMSLLARTPDPFSSVLYTINIEPAKQLAKTASTTRITLAPVINKLIALAIAENPVFNQILFGSSVYQMQEIHIANIVLIPGTDAGTYVILENPHQKSLKTIQQELFSIMMEKTKHYTKPQNRVVSLVSRFCYKTGLYRLIGEKRAFTIAYERGLMSNISLSNHVYNTPANFIMVKDIISPMNISPRFHVCGPAKQPFVENDTVTIKETITFHVTTDHRIVDGFRSHQFGQTLERIASNPEKYL